MDGSQLQQLSIQEKAAQLYHGVGLAPMVRASTTPLRVLALQYGADFVYTEEFIDKSISAAATVRMENETLGTIDYLKGSISAKAHRRLVGAPPLVLRIDPAIERGRLIAQLGSGDAEEALQAALHIHQDVDAIDLNMGCPKRFSTSGGMGSALLQDPDRACRIVRTLAEAMNARGKPVSCKIRLLKDSLSTVDLVSSLIGAGASAVAIHGRRVGDESHEPADWNTLKEVVKLAKERHPSVPILINGDFYTRNDFTQFMAETGADGVLLARPALYNTSIFRKPPNHNPAGSNHQNYGYDSPLLLDRTTVVEEYLKLAWRYQIHYKNVKYVVCEFMTNRRSPMPLVPKLPQVWPGEQTIAKVCKCHTLADICKVWKLDSNALALPSGSTQELQQLPPGEHQYSDEYFLGDARNAGTTTVDNVPASSSCSSPPAKRCRANSSGAGGGGGASPVAVEAPDVLTE